MATRNAQPPPQAGQSAHPFRFVPVLPELAVTDTPVWHDTLLPTGENAGDDEALLTGELRCELTARTPLHVGWKQTEVQGRNGQAYKESEPLTIGGGRNGEPGPVVIPGSTLNGMLRHAIGALLCAPMERVAERAFSYRPNAAFASGEATLRCLPAIVRSAPANGWDASSVVVVDILDRADDVALVPGSRLKALLAAAGVSQANWQAHATAAPVAMPHGATLAGAMLQPGSASRTSSIRTAAGRCRLDDWQLAYYACGIDGGGVLAHAFCASFDSKEAALVRKGAPVTPGIQVPSTTLRQLELTLDHLADDEAGHLRDHPNVHAAAGKRAVQRAIAATRPHLLAPGTVVFVELAATGKPPVAADVKAILPTFRARVRYKDTVRTRNVGGLVTTRPEVRPTATELSAASADGQPAADWQLSAARLLFGLNAEDDMWPESIAKSHYGRFSGRIACNAAIEVIEREQRRFVVGTQGHHRWVFALRPQGSPKPSAVEHYVAQDANVLARRTDGGTLVTWGDGDQTGGELAGRKFYLHQPDIIGHLANAEANEEELRDSAQHCPRLKYLSTASSRFHCTVRFHNLRPWELGALLLALQPTAEGVRTVEFGVLGSSGPVARYFDKLRSGVAAPEMMHKLGRGRAYGLGSIEARIDSVALVERSADGAALLAPPAVGREELFRKMFGALARKIARCLPAAADRQEWVNRVLVNWVDVHLFRNRTPAAGYPALAERCARSSQEIIAYHNQVRALHLSGRKSGPPRNRPAIPVLYGILPEPDPDW